MKRIDWNKTGASKRVLDAIHDKNPFVVVLEGPLAMGLTKAFGPTTVGITSTHVKLIIAMTALIGIAGLVLYALSKGYQVSGKATTPEGTTYEINFDPKKDV